MVLNIFFYYKIILTGDGLNRFGMEKKLIAHCRKLQLAPVMGFRSMISTEMLKALYYCFLFLAPLHSDADIIIFSLYGIIFLTIIRLHFQIDLD
jgi:hypothetical protein